ncbi:MAG: TetR/AcrR family transcriptional regulator [Aggregatilineales bacterium]
MKQSILKVAREIIRKNGVDDLNMREIAKRIGYSPGSIYSYFNNKQALIEAVATQGYEYLASYFQSVDESLPPKIHLTELALVYLKFALENPDYYIVMFTTVPSPEAIAEIRAEGSVFDTLIHAIQRGIDKGVFKPKPDFEAHNMAYAAWAHVHGVAMLRITFLEAPEAIEGLNNRETFETFFRGLGMEEP